MRDLTGKTAFVTGAASGIGLGVATALAQAGVKVMLCDIEADALESAVASLKATNADVEGLVADVSLKAELQRAAEATVARFGKVHILVNNAGVSGGGRYGVWTDEGWAWTLEVNLMAVIWGVEAFGPLIEAHGEGGHVVSTASVAGLTSRSSAPYNVSKYGVVALSEGLRPELAAKGIGVSVLCPGLVRTGIMDCDRNIPARFEGRGSGRGPSLESDLALMRSLVAGGLDPAYVGELVREGIEGDWPYIFTDTQFETAVDARFAAIKAGFDRIRDRTPAR